jgi:hypothetical protein
LPLKIKKTRGRKREENNKQGVPIEEKDFI